jgi:hypothetical protein
MFPPQSESQRDPPDPNLSFLVMAWPPLLTDSSGPSLPWQDEQPDNNSTGKIRQNRRQEPQYMTGRKTHAIMVNLMIVKALACRPRFWICKGVKNTDNMKGIVRFSHGTLLLSPGPVPIKAQLFLGYPTSVQDTLEDEGPQDFKEPGPRIVNGSISDIDLDRHSG